MIICPNCDVQISGAFDLSKRRGIEIICPICEEITNMSELDDPPRRCFHCNRRLNIRIKNEKS